MCVCVNLGSTTYPDIALSLCVFQESIENKYDDFSLSLSLSWPSSLRTCGRQSQVGFSRISFPPTPNQSSLSSRGLFLFFRSLVWVWVYDRQNLKSCIPSSHCLSLSPRTSFTPFFYTVISHQMPHTTMVYTDLLLS